eukprot:366523-Chlamydomonas_euryale.AAC.6
MQGLLKAALAADLHAQLVANIGTSPYLHAFPPFCRHFHFCACMPSCMDRPHDPCAAAHSRMHAHAPIPRRCLCTMMRRTTGALFLPCSLPTPTATAVLACHACLSCFLPPPRCQSSTQLSIHPPRLPV